MRREVTKGTCPLMISCTRSTSMQQSTQLASINSPCCHRPQAASLEGLKDFCMHDPIHVRMRRCVHDSWESWKWGKPKCAARPMTAGPRFLRQLRRTVAVRTHISNGGAICSPCNRWIKRTAFAAAALIACTLHGCGGRAATVTVCTCQTPLDSSGTLKSRLLPAGRRTLAVTC